MPHQKRTPTLSCHPHSVKTGTFGPQHQNLHTTGKQPHSDSPTVHNARVTAAYSPTPPPLSTWARTSRTGRRSSPRARSSLWRSAPSSVERSPRTRTRWPHSLRVKNKKCKETKTQARTAQRGVRPAKQRSKRVCSRQRKIHATTDAACVATVLVSINRPYCAGHQNDAIIRGDANPPPETAT